MRSGIEKTRQAVGFLTVVEDAQHGLFGGYLLLDLAGRPLEFHCTAPVKPNRAQQILYGPTLESFLYGEQIGATLVTQSKIEPLVVCTDRAPVLAVREMIAMPVAFVEAGAREEPQRATVDNLASATARTDASQPAAERFCRLDAPHSLAPPLVSFSVGRNCLAVAQRSVGDRELIAERLAEMAATVDLAEPFTRIRQAIDEAQQAAR